MEIEHGYIRISTDDIRLEITGNAEDQSKNAEVFSIARNRVNSALSENKSVVVDATNLNPKDRKDFILIGKNTMHLFLRPWLKCLLK
jgi:predicted kinase